jgi:hypothetical protein
LGLSIASEIIEAHGGPIDVSCPPGGGTTFRLIVPIYQAVPALAHGSRTPHPANPSPSSDSETGYADAP